VKHSKILAVQRGPESNHPYQWEFPGGKIHRNETAEQAIIREIKEELNVQIEVIMQIEPIEHDYGTKQIRLIPLIVKIISGEIVLTEHIAQRWFEPDEWNDYYWQEADSKVILKNFGMLISGKKNR
jgi:8-oxo-dGTP diphosphatase